jgi:hypothetical protein
LIEGLTQTGDVAVAKNTQCCGDESLAVAIRNGVLDRNEPYKRLGYGQADGFS